jgi:hypothetical protein
MYREFVVDPRLPYAGLGDMLLVWAKAALFANINAMPMLQPNWQSLHIGPWLRRERCKRYYGSFFLSRNYKSRFRSFLTGVGHQKYIHSNRLIKLIDFSLPEYSGDGKHVFLFDNMPPWNDYFHGLKESQKIIKKLLYADIRPLLLKRILRRHSPEIGIHIRLSDFLPPPENSGLDIYRNVSTPMEWYIDTLLAFRRVLGYEVVATVFSDGNKSELAEILKLPKVLLSSETSALSDLITMSRSKVLIASSGSSFSSWASYLGQCPTVWDARRSHLYQSVFPDDVKCNLYGEGFDPWLNSTPDLLVQNLITLFKI